jgi:hypothetical protein
MIYGIIDKTLDVGRHQPKVKMHSDVASLDFAEIQKNIQERKALETAQKINNVVGDENITIDEMKHTRTNITYRLIKHSNQVETIGIVQAE